jgi:hypothetical protein
MPVFQVKVERLRRCSAADRDRVAPNGLEARARHAPVAAGPPTAERMGAVRLAGGGSRQNAMHLCRTPTRWVRACTRMTGRAAGAPHRRKDPMHQWAACSGARSGRKPLLAMPWGRSPQYPSGRVARDARSGEPRQNPMHLCRTLTGRVAARAGMTDGGAGARNPRKDPMDQAAKRLTDRSRRPRIAPWPGHVHRLVRDVPGPATTSLIPARKGVEGAPRHRCEP